MISPRHAPGRPSELRRPSAELNSRPPARSTAGVELGSPAVEPQGSSKPSSAGGRTLIVAVAHGRRLFGVSASTIEAKQRAAARVSSVRMLDRGRASRLRSNCVELLDDRRRERGAVARRSRPSILTPDARLPSSRPAAPARSAIARPCGAFPPAGPPARVIRPLASARRPPVERGALRKAISLQQEPGRPQAAAATLEVLSKNC